MHFTVCQKFKPLSISLSPNVERDDVRLSLSLIFRPKAWRRGKAVTELEDQFRKYLGVKHAFAFNSGRTALMAILKALDLSLGDEVMVQAFTCNAAVNPIIWTGLRPIYIDCDDTFNIDAGDLVKKSTQKTKAVMVQHTFGTPAGMDKILEICRQNNLILIEDCAHSLGAEYNGQRVGTFGRASFFSFGRDKIISSVYGGMAVTDEDGLAEKIRQFQAEIGYPSPGWTLQQLLHPVLLRYLILPLYDLLKIGKGILVFFQWFRILPKAVHWKEKIGEMPGYFPKKMPNALAILAQNQFQKLNRFNENRKKIVDFYFNRLKDSPFELAQIPAKTKPVFLRLAIKHPNAHEIIKKAWRKNILLGDWYASPIFPKDTLPKKIFYTKGSCKNAEILAKTTFNLPTHINISMADAQKIVDFLLATNQ